MKRFNLIGPVPLGHATEARRRQSLTEMGATIALAMLLHFVCLLAWHVWHPRGDEWFSTVQVEHPDVKRVDIVAATVPVAPPSPPPPPPAPRAGGAPAEGRRGPLAGPPRPIKGPAKGAPRPRIIAANNSQGPVVPVDTHPAPAPATNLNKPPGIPEGIPNAGGQNGTGSGGQGDSGVGTGGPGGNGGSGGPGGGGQERVYCVIEYDRFRKIGVENLTPQQEQALGTFGRNPPPNWPDLCRIIGLDYTNDVSRRPTVEPVFITGHMPSLSGRDMIGRTEGLVGLTTRISPDGRAETAISTSCGDRHLDAIGFAIGQGLVWLPGLEQGRAVERTITYAVRFRSDKLGAYRRDPQGGGPPDQTPQSGAAPGAR